MGSTVPTKVRSGNDFLDVLSEAEGKCTEHLLGLLLHTQQPPLLLTLAQIRFL